MYTSIHIGDKAEKLAMRYDEDNLKYELDRAIEIIGQMRTDAMEHGCNPDEALQEWDIYPYE